MIRLRRLLKRHWIPIILRVWPLARLWYRLWGLRLDGCPDDKVWYFAYGANLHDDVFLGRRRMTPLEWRAGRVPNWRLRFNLEGRPRGRAAPANIEPSDGDEVWGMLYHITRREMVRLSATEGVPGRRYRPVWIDVEDRDGSLLAACSLLADSRSEEGSPSLRYITLLRQGARQHDLPADWIEKLDRVVPANDSA